MQTTPPEEKKPKIKDQIMTKLAPGLVEEIIRLHEPRFEEKKQVQRIDSENVMTRENQDMSYTSASPVKSKSTIEKEQRERIEREQQVLSAKENFVIMKPLRQNLM